MKFKILNDKPSEENGYKVVINTMRGDADSYHDVTVAYFAEDEVYLLEELITMLNEIKGHSTYWEHRGLYYYHEVWRAWFEESAYEDNVGLEAGHPDCRFTVAEVKERYTKVQGWWQSCEYAGYHDSVDEITVTFHKDGVEYPVEIEY